MTRTKPKYEPAEPQQQASTSFAGLPFSLNLKEAQAYTNFSGDGAIRAAITSGELAIVSDRHYRILRADLERWVESKRHFVARKTESHRG